MQDELLHNLFRTEYRKITAVLVRQFGFNHIEVAEDIASETFLHASELWGLKGLPENPVAWLYTVAKNNARNQLKHQNIFNKKIAPDLKLGNRTGEEIEIDLTQENIRDSQLRMMFVVCHPILSSEEQIGLALQILCGFGADEIASAFLTNKDSIYKRLQRAREKLRNENVQIELPSAQEINKRLESVLLTLYLLFNEGYHSSNGDIKVRKDLCLEAIRLTYLLTENPETNSPSVNSLLALMCFHSSRFEARTGINGEVILYADQDVTLWNEELIEKGKHFFHVASQGKEISRYFLEAGIASMHTDRTDTAEKWEAILQLYNHLLSIEYSPMAALNRTYALARARGYSQAIEEAKCLDLKGNHLYYALLGELHKNSDRDKAHGYFTQALNFAKSSADKDLMKKKLLDL